jgi:predicted nuclease of predicted toxin-antitoxin system
VRLLFDENLRPRLVTLLAEPYPDSQHVDLAGLRGQSDETIWLYAGRQDLVIVSKDNDFRQLSFLRSHPPKVVWVSVGNAGTGEIADLLTRRRGRISTFLEDSEGSLLVLQLA